MTTVNSRNEFDNFVKNNKYVIVKFKAEWCGPCKKISPFFNQMMSKMDNDVKLLVIDADNNRDICSKYRIRTIPTFISFLNGDPLYIYSTSNTEEIVKFFSDTMKKYVMDKNN